VPRYFFNMVDGHSRSLVKDSEGAEFSGMGEARKEAVGLARDVARHGLRRSTTWQVVVTDETGDEVLTVLLSEVGAGKTGAADIFHAGFPHGCGAVASADRRCAPAQEQSPRESCERHRRRAEG